MEEKVYFKNSDGLNLCGVFTFPKIQTQTCIVLCHGITVDKNEGGIFTELANKLSSNFAVFRFDFRGHGESEGNSIDMTIEGEEKDFKAAFEYLKGKGFNKFGLVSASFAGGATCFFLSKHKNPVSALVLWNALIDYGSKIDTKTEWQKKYWGKPAYERAKEFGFTEIGSRKFKVGFKLMEEVYSLKPWGKLLKIDIPMLFIHGDKDTYVPYQDSVKYSKMVKDGQLVTIKGAEHGFHDNPEHGKEADQATIQFFKRNL